MHPPLKLARVVMSSCAREPRARKPVRRPDFEVAAPAAPRKKRRLEVAATVISPEDAMDVVAFPVTELGHGVHAWTPQEDSLLVTGV